MPLSETLNCRGAHHPPGGRSQYRELRVDEVGDLSRYLSGVTALYSTELLDGIPVGYSILKKGGWWCRLLEWLDLDRQCWVYKVISSDGLRDEILGMEDRLRSYSAVTGKGLVIYGVFIGVGIRDNPYRRKGLEFYVTSVFDPKLGRRLTLEEKLGVCANLDLHLVPLRRVIATEELFSYDSPVEYLQSMADGPSVMTITHPAVKRRGLVFRSPLDDSISFKVVSSDWLFTKQ